MQEVDFGCVCVRACVRARTRVCRGCERVQVKCVLFPPAAVDGDGEASSVRAGVGVLMPAVLRQSRGYPIDERRLPGS